MFSHLGLVVSDDAGKEKDHQRAVGDQVEHVGDCVLVRAVDCLSIMTTNVKS